MRALFAAFAAAVLCACAPVAPATPAAAAPDQTFTRDQQPTEAAQTACAAAHGAYHQVGLMATWVCVTPMADAGKVCSGRSQCTGQCIYEGGDRQPAQGAAVQGRCQRTNVQFGCFAAVEGGRAQPALCVD
ncbi:MAG: hypothetical protein QM759_16540 [Terricaulis sp.]